MNLLKKIRFSLLAGILLAQVPQVCGMEQGGQQPVEQRNEEPIMIMANGREFDERELSRAIARIEPRYQRRIQENGVRRYVSFAGSIFAFSTALAVLTPLLFSKCFYGDLQSDYVFYNYKYSLPAIVPHALLFPLLDPNLRSSVSTVVGDHVRRVSSKMGINASNINQRDLAGETLLMRCTKNDDCSGVRKCLAVGADVNLTDAVAKDALTHAVAGNSEESIRALLSVGAQKDRAQKSVEKDIAAHTYTIENADIFVERFGEGHERQRINDLPKLQQMQHLFSQTPAQLIAPLTQAQKAEYRKMFAAREQIKPSLHGSLMLYEHLDDATALKKYLKYNNQIYQGIGAKKAGVQDVMPHVMSFLRKSGDADQVRLDDALCKARVEEDQELSELLTANGATLDENKFYDAQINKQFWQ